MVREAARGANTAQEAAVAAIDTPRLRRPQGAPAARQSRFRGGRLVRLGSRDFGVALRGYSAACSRWAAPRRSSCPRTAPRVCTHLYRGGGVTADGPALLVRKSIADKVSLSGSYYVDAVSNASIDVVTTASPFKETRKA